MTQEQLGREREYRPTCHASGTGKHHQRPVRHGLARTQAAVQCHGRAECVEIQAIGVIDLVALALREPVLNASDGVVEGRIAHVVLQRGNACHARRRDIVGAGGVIDVPWARLRAGGLTAGQPGLRLRGAQVRQGGEQQGAELPGCATRRDRMHAGQAHAEFVIGQQHGMQAVARGFLHFAKRVGKHTGLVASHLAHEPGIQTRSTDRFRAVVQQCERGQGRFTLHEITRRTASHGRTSLWSAGCGARRPP